jgi:hypothetical protein
MKHITCQQLGGPCTQAHESASADVIMKARWKNPFEGMGWYRQIKRDLAALPEG